MHVLGIIFDAGGDLFWCVSKDLPVLMWATQRLPSPCAGSCLRGARDCGVTRSENQDSVLQRPDEVVIGLLRRLVE